MASTTEKRLKAECFRCKINKWAADFKEGSITKISSTSVCLSCEQAAKIEAQQKEIDWLKNRDQEREKIMKKLEERIRKIETLIPKEGNEKEERDGDRLDKQSHSSEVKVVQEKVKELSEIVKENRDVIVETGKHVVEMREQIASFKDNGNFHTVKGRKNTGSKIYKKSHGIALANRFEVLEDEVDDQEVEAILIGDSIVREQSHYFAMRNKRKRIVKSYPGCKAKKVKDEVSALNIKSKHTCIIANAGGNDLFLRGEKVGNSEPLLEDLTALVDSLAEKTYGGILIGIMPRMYASYFAMSKAIGINERIGKYCKGKNVEFFDVWNDFVGKRQYFKKDGIHLNETGHKKLDEILSREYKRVKDKLNLLPTYEPQHTLATVQVSTAENCRTPKAPEPPSIRTWVRTPKTFEGFPKEN